VSKSLTARTVGPVAQDCQLLLVNEDNVDLD